jgi:hypothetical protein
LTPFGLRANERPLQYRNHTQEAVMPRIDHLADLPCFRGLFETA